jgi:superfamily II DNA/RNA helicase
MNKIEVVARILQAQGRGLTMIFTRTKRAADRVAEDLDFRGFAAAAVHGDLGQGARERALRAFRVGKIDILVATDVAARGLDVSGVTHVINYDCPEDADAYVHRIGRTGRAGATGVAVTFVDWEDMPRWRLIDKSLGLDLPEPPETYHTSSYLYSDLDIPTEMTGTLPTAERTRAGLAAEVEEDLGGRSRRRPAGGRGDAAGRDRSRSRRGTSDRSTTDRGTAESGRRGASDAPAGVPEAADGTSRSSRQRRRRRSGVLVAGDTDVAVEQSGAEATSTVATLAAAFVAPTASAAAATPAASTAESGEGDAARKPRRRRRRSGGGRSSASEATTP